MNVPKGYIADVKIPVPVTTDCTYTVTNPAGTELGAGTVTPANGLATVTLPYAAVFKEGPVTVSVTFNTDSQDFTLSKEVYVYTPYLELWEAKKIMDMSTEEEIWGVQLAVKGIIDAYCGQRFGLVEKEVEVIAGKSIGLTLPERLVTLNSLSEFDIDRYNVDTVTGTSYLGKYQYMVVGDGWFIKRPDNAWSWDTRYDDNEYYSSDPIVAPGRSTGLFTHDAAYTVNGVWGYEQVPLEVVEAAKLLLNDYACAEQLYRDRFLESVKFADWRISLAKAAYYDTGNARANELLAPYVVHRMVVI